MAVGRDGRQLAGNVMPEKLACMILHRIRGRDLPAGMELLPGRIAPVMQATSEDVAAALELLEDRGATIRLGDGWMVRADRQRNPRDILLRAHPLLTTIVRLAAKRITKSQAMSVMAAFERFSGEAGPLDAAGRAEVYRGMLMLIADASGSSFHQAALRLGLQEAGDIIELLVSQSMQFSMERDPDDELARLARAMMSHDPESAVQAMEDHMLVVGQHMDRLR